MNKLLSAAGISVLLVSGHAVAGLFDSDGSTYEECMEARRNDIKNDGQLVIAGNYCRQKHPLPKMPAKVDSPAAAPPDPVELHLIFGTTPANAIARPAIASVLLTQVALAHDGQQFGSGARTPDFKWYTRVDIINRNQFPLSAVIVGVTQRSGRRCDWEARNYSEVYQCNGYAGSGMSGSFRCDIPNSEKHRIGQYCMVGFGIEGTFADLNRYLPGK
ncbi:hypothetical protein [Burkholderia sola]|uniref:hypothetical protein n=1 Tax=Burkholderia sola TaxID=2843302 RepID=UPI0023DD7281|nr:hypothetical protein [Burkholderia sola]MDF3086373.1 hypothetical protein [Burkholderia sola]